MQQRAVRDQDLDLIMRFGTEVDNGLILTKDDVKKAVSFKREEIGRLEKLSGKVVIIKGDTVVTTYVPSKRRLKRFLRSRC